MDENKPTVKKITPKKHIIPDKDKKKEMKSDQKEGKENTIENTSDKIMKIPTPKTDITESKPVENVQEKKEESSDQSKRTKRHSFINDFAALEKTYRMLGIQKDNFQMEEEEKPMKKKNASEGKAKKKNKTKSKVSETVAPTQKKEENILPDEPIKPKLDAIDKEMNELKRNYFQEMINEKKGIVQPSLNGPKLRKKTNLVSNFEEKTRETNKRSSLIREDVKVN